MTKLKEKEQAIQLRQEGESLKTIASRLGVAKSSVSLWVRDTVLSPAALKKITDSLTNGQQASVISKRSKTQELLKETRNRAESLVSSIGFDPNQYLLVCSLLYWCEGGKSVNDNTLTFSNSDPEIISAYINSLRKSFSLDESKFRIVMHLHEYHSEANQKEFWSNITNVPTTQFRKTYLKPHTGKTIRPGYPGCIHIKYYDVKVARAVSAAARAFLAKAAK